MVSVLRRGGWCGLLRGRSGRRRGVVRRLKDVDGEAWWRKKGQGAVEGEMC